MRWLLGWATRAVLVGVAASIVVVLALRVFAPPVTSLMLFRAGEAVAEGRRPSAAWEWTRLEAVSPALLRAVIASEDARFFAHAGGG